MVLEKYIYRRELNDSKRIVKLLVSMMVLLFPLTLIGGNPGDYKLIHSEGKVGLIDSFGNELIPAEYEGIGWSDIEASSDSQLSIYGDEVGYKKDGKWGLMSLNNKELTPPIFELIKPFGETTYVVGRKDRLYHYMKYGIVNAKGKSLTDVEFVSLRHGKNSAIVRKLVDNRVFYGVIDLKGKLVMKFQDEKIEYLDEGMLAVGNEAQKFALADEYGEFLSDFKYDSIDAYELGWARFYIHGKAGLMDGEGNEKFSAKYKHINVFQDKVLSYDDWLVWDNAYHEKASFQAEIVNTIDDKLLSLKVGAYYQLLPVDEGKVDETLYDSLRRFNSQGYAVAFFKGKAGVINQQGDWVIQAVSDEIEETSFGFVTMSYTRNDGQVTKWYNAKGSLMIDREFQDLDLINEEYIAFMGNDERWGVLDNSGKVVIENRFDEIIAYEQNLFKVVFSGQEAYVHLNGEMAMLPEAGTVSVNSKGNFLVSNRFGRTLYSRQGHELFYTYDSLVDTELGYQVVGDYGKIGFVSEEGKVILDPEYDEYYNVSGDSLFAVRKSGFYLLVGKDYFIRLSESDEITSIKKANGEWIGVRKDGKFGLVDSEGRLRIANRYDDIGVLQENRVPVKLRGHWGFVDEREILVIQPWYDTVEPFYKGATVVSKDMKYGLLQSDGIEKVALKYDTLIRTSSGGALVRLEGKWGYCNSEGVNVITCTYDQVKEVNGNSLIVHKRGKYGVNSLDGVPKIPMVYDLIYYDDENGLFLGKNTQSWQKLTETL
ncbi:hypothetical protein AUTU_35160 [Aureibacter tunicatorum]|nr:hypothetical protein AUTU_35160 [Aureibacter tunicatorum]